MYRITVVGCVCSFLPALVAYPVLPKKVVKRVGDGEGAWRKPLPGVRGLGFREIFVRVIVEDRQF